jgi:hypothetical protein
MEKHMHLTKASAFGISLLTLLGACQAVTEEHSDWTEAIYSSGWGPCPENHVCFVNMRIKRTTKTVERTGSNGQSIRQLNEQEWRTLENLLTLAKRDASNCPSPPTDVFEDLEIIYKDNSKFSKSVTGCSYEKSTNSVKTLKEWLSK